MKRLIIFFSFFCFLQAKFSLGQVTFTLLVPDNTPRGSAVFLAGSVNQWVPGDARFEFKPNNKGEFSLTLDSMPSSFEYKICRGSWTNVELDSLGRDLANRIYIDSLGKHVLVSVAGWRDKIPAKQLASTASSNVHFLPTSIEIPQLKRRRTVRVYFPPNYSASQGFPVIYMFYGQNLFDNSTAFSGEWGVDETLDTLYRNRAFSCIVVAIYHGDSERLNEQTPWPDLQKRGGDGAKFAKFIVQDLKPYIDKHYRTLPDRDNTIIIGSSLGGLMSLYMALEYPEVFGKAGVFSPSLWWSEIAFEQIQKFKKRRFQKIYVVAGEKESEKMQVDIQRAEKLLKEVGFGENELVVKLDPEGKHNEQFWAKEFPDAVKWMFGIMDIEKK